MIITILYYILTAFIALLIIWNFIKSKKWQEEALYIIILIPFLLRLLRLK
ncbi:MAG: hypothetical protein KAW19_10155 [Candidatus Aminicenantes bacterium]|nr:hypothetical protein [Candidatus Aminicenantes bacterium]